MDADLRAETETQLAHYRDMQTALERREEFFGIVSSARSDQDAVDRVAKRFDLPVTRVEAILSAPVTQWTDAGQEGVTSEIKRLEALLASD